MKRLFLFTAGVLVLAPLQALQPRKSAALYPARAASDGAQIGIRRLPAEEISSMFSPALSQDYVVVEIGVFPSAGQPFAAAPDDFTLRIDGSRLVKPVDAKTVLAETAFPAPAAARPPADKASSKKTKNRARKNAPAPAERLAADAFRATSSSEAFAGYLYFPVAGLAGSRFEVEYFGGMKRLRVPI
jgi:hypothetical protein